MAPNIFQIVMFIFGSSGKYDSIKEFVLIARYSTLYQSVLKDEKILFFEAKYPKNNDDVMFAKTSPQQYRTYLQLFINQDKQKNLICHSLIFQFFTNRKSIAIF